MAESLAMQDVGHSSLAFVLQFPIDAIKMDRAFVTHVTRGRADRAIARAIVCIGSYAMSPVCTPKCPRRRSSK